MDPGIESWPAFFWWNIEGIPAFTGEEIGDDYFVACFGGEMVGTAEGIGVEAANVLETH